MLSRTGWFFLICSLKKVGQMISHIRLKATVWLIHNINSFVLVFCWKNEKEKKSNNIRYIYLISLFFNVLCALYAIFSFCHLHVLLAFKIFQITFVIHNRLKKKTENWYVISGKECFQYVILNQINDFFSFFFLRKGLQYIFFSFFLLLSFDDFRFFFIIVYYL